MFSSVSCVAFSSIHCIHSYCKQPSCASVHVLLVSTLLKASQCKLTNKKLILNHVFPLIFDCSTLL